jgi:hypothetical protein
MNNLHFVLWLNVPEWIHRDANYQDPIKSEVAHRYLDEAWEKAKQICPFQDLIDHSADLTAIIERLVEILCGCGLDYDPIVIVDGYDEITEEQAKAFSKRVLEMFISHDCIRMILAYRDDWKLQQDTLRLNESNPQLHITNVDKSFAIEQFQLLFPSHLGMDRDLLTWMNQLQHYQWNIPLINRILFQKGFNSNPLSLRPLENQDFYECFKLAIERPDSSGKSRYEMLTPEQFKLIHNIAIQLPNEWSATAVEEHFEISNFYMDDRVIHFFDLGLIEQEGNIHQIVSGLRGLLREITDPSSIRHWKGTLNNEE